MWQQLKNYYHWLIAFMAVVLYRYPAKQLTVIGVTGTDGKTTTASAIAHILRSANKKVGLLSTVGAFIGTERYNLGLHVTTPSAFTVQKFLRKMVDQGCEIAVIEATSHGLDQNRLLGCNIQYALLTNITHEHLDYHKTMNAYTRAKVKLFRNASVVFLNADGDWYNAVKQLLPGKKIISFGLSPKAQVTPQTFPFTWPLMQNYNRANALGAIAVAKACGIDDATIRSALASFPGVEGRMQRLDFGQPFSVIVDFAHTPYAIGEVLKALRPNTRDRLIAVFGSAGLRDKTKRPITGTIAASLADISIVTTDDPATENVNDIIGQIVKGIEKTGAKELQAEELMAYQGNDHVFVRIPDRKNAIHIAIKIAQNGDTIALLGKGHQKSLSVGTEELPWDEAQIATDALQEFDYGK